LTHPAPGNALADKPRGHFGLFLLSRLRKMLIGSLGWRESVSWRLRRLTPSRAYVSRACAELSFVFTEIWLQAFTTQTSHQCYRLPSQWKWEWVML